MKYYKQLDGLRAIAIIMVMVAHWYQHSLQIPILKNLPWGTGVNLFFVLSGFLITGIILDFKEINAAKGRSQFHSIKSFYIRRTLRIFPIYYLTVFIVLVFGIEKVRELLPWLLTYTSNIYITIHNTYIGSFTHFWSLAVEEQFYLVWVFLVVFIPSVDLKRVIFFLIALSLLILYYLWYFTGYSIANALTICQMHTLGSGALIAWLIKYRKEAFDRMNLTLLKSVCLFFSVIYVLVFVYQKPDSLYLNVQRFNEPITGFIYFLIVLIAVKDGFKSVIKFILENKVMIYLGRISYGLYIYHLFIPVIYWSFVHKYINLDLSPFNFFCLYLVVNIAISTISWYLIEKPVNGLKRYFKY